MLVYLATAALLTVWLDFRFLDLSNTLMYKEFIRDILSQGSVGSGGTKLLCDAVGILEYLCCHLYRVLLYSWLQLVRISIPASCCSKVWDESLFLCYLSGCELIYSFSLSKLANTMFMDSCMLQKDPLCLNVEYDDTNIRQKSRLTCRLRQVHCPAISWHPQQYCGCIWNTQWWGHNLLRVISSITLNQSSGLEHPALDFLGQCRPWFVVPKAPVVLVWPHYSFAVSH